MDTYTWTDVKTIKAIMMMKQKLHRKNFHCFKILLGGHSYIENKPKVYPIVKLGKVLALASILLIGGCFVGKHAHAFSIDMKKIAQIESSGCVQQYGHFEHARGCWQITEPSLNDWNAFHPNQKHSLHQMLDKKTCFKVANWYMNKRIPQMLKHFGLEDTVRNRLIAYNSGIKTLVEGRKLSKVTQKYLIKYGA